MIKRRPHRYRRNGKSETSQVPVKPSRHHALLLDPAERFTPGVAAQTLLPSTLKTVSASGTYSFRGSITRPSDSLCTLRSQGRPCTTQHSVPAGCQSLPGRLDPCRVPSEVFSRVLLHMTSNSSRLCLAHFQRYRSRPVYGRRCCPRRAARWPEPGSGCLYQYDHLYRRSGSATVSVGLDFPNNSR